MALTTDNIAYAASATAACSIGSVASSSTVGRQSTPIDNTSNLYDDVLFTLSFLTSTAAAANDKTVYVYFFGSEDGNIYTSDDAAIGASDAAYTINAPTNLKGPLAIYAPTSSKTYVGVTSVAQYFGGVMPRKWGVVVINFTGQTLATAESSHQKSYTGITYTNQ